ncbi:MAG: metallophosphoesterase family protein [Thermomicrobia bacterium]|nr:metallophosphoesterase family protein [Thermomicrobia bacterium]
MVLQRLMRIGTILRRGALAIGGLGAAFLGYAGGIERRWLEVTVHRVEMADIPPEWDGVRIVQLSDFHLGFATPYAMLARAIAETVAMQPDLIVLTGDYANDGRPLPLDLLAPLAKAAPTIAILGNHDYLQRTIGADLIAKELEKHLEGPGADVKGIVARMQGKSPSLVLVHEPDVIDRFPDRWAGLTLSGHTHSAQIRLSPIRRYDWVDWPISEMQSAYPRGWFNVRGNRLYVSHGLGVSTVPLRFCARPELSCFTLTRKGLSETGENRREAEDAESAEREEE